MFSMANFTDTKTKPKKGLSRENLRKENGQVGFTIEQEKRFRMEWEKITTLLNKYPERIKNTYIAVKGRAV